MYFDIALLSSHGSSRAHYLEAIWLNLSIPYCQACTESEDKGFYAEVINNKLNQHKFLEKNLLNIDNSLVNRGAPLHFYKRLFHKNALFINSVRDPVKKFCTLCNFFNYYCLVFCNYEYLEKSIAEHIKYLICTRYWDHMMAIPFLRFRNISDNFIYLDSEDLREATAPGTLSLIARRCGLSYSPQGPCSLMETYEYERKFLNIYNIFVFHNARRYLFRMSPREPENGTFVADVDSAPLAKLFAVEKIYIYACDKILCEDNVEDLTHSVQCTLNDEYANIEYRYRKYVSRKVSVDFFTDMLYSDVKLYDAFKYSICHDADYIIKECPASEARWDAYRRVNKDFPVANATSSECSYSMQNDYGLALLRDGWGDTHEAGVDAVVKTPQIFVPIKQAQLSLLALHFSCYAPGTLTVFADGCKVADGDLLAGCLFIPIPKALRINKKYIILKLCIDSERWPCAFTLHTLLDSAPAHTSA